MRSKMRKNWMAIAGIAIAVGIVLVGIGGILGGTPIYSFGYDSENKWQLTTDNMPEELVVLDQTEVEAFDSLYVNTGVMDVYVESAEDYSIAYQSASGALDIEVREGTLNVTKPSRMYLFSWGLFAEGQSGVDQYYLKITLPKDAILKDLKIVSETGNVYISDTVSTGKLDLQMEFGAADIRSSEAAEVSVATDTGNINVEEVTADKIALKSEFGGLTGRNITATSLAVSLEVGDVNLEEMTLQAAEITTEFGEVNLGLTGSEDEYHFSLEAEFGNVTFNGGKSGGSYSKSGSDGRQMKISTETGNIDVKTK